MQAFGGPVVGLLVDVVTSRNGDRQALHETLLSGCAEANSATHPLEELHPTVGDELQGSYPTLGEAFKAWFTLRLAVAPERDLRCGIGGGSIEIIDGTRGIQDGSAWWRARAALSRVEALSGKKGHASARTGVQDERTGAIPQIDAVARLVDAQLARLRPGAMGTLRGMWAGLDNTAIAKSQQVTASANSQRVLGNDLRPLYDAMTALGSLP